MIYNFKDHIKGDTFPGVEFTFKLNGSVVDLSGATIEMNVRQLSKVGDLSDSFANTSIGGITVTDAANGIFEFDEQIIDIVALLHYYDIQVTLSNSKVYTPFEGTWNILQDCT